LAVYIIVSMMHGHTNIKSLCSTQYNKMILFVDLEKEHFQM